MNERVILKALENSEYKVLQDANGLILSYVRADGDGEINIQDLIEILKRPYISVRHKICVLKPDESVDYEIPKDDIVEDSISFSENLQNGQRKSLSFTLINKDGKYTPCVNYDYGGGTNSQGRSFGVHTPLWGNSRFSYEVGVRVRTDKYYWFAKGIYVLASAGANGGDNRELSITLKDKYAIFEGNMGKMLYTTEIKYDNDVNLVVKDILRQDTGMGTIYDYKKPMIDLSYLGFKTQTSIRKEQGDTYASVFEELFTQMNASYYYNDVGNFMVIPLMEEMKDEHKPVSWTYLKSQGDLIDINKDYNIEEAINIIYVEGNNVSSKTYSALVVNNDPRSPFCVGYIGKRIGDPVTDCNVWNVQQARELGIYELRKNTLNCLSLKSEVRFNPLVKLDTLIEIEHDFFNLNGEKFIVKDISFTSNQGTMNLSIVDIQTLSFLKAGDGSAIGLSE